MRTCWFAEEQGPAVAEREPGVAGLPPRAAAGVHEGPEKDVVQKTTNAKYMELNRGQ